MKHIHTIMLAGTFALTLSAGPALADLNNDRIYIPLGSENRVLVIDARTDKIIDRIDGVPAVHGLAATPDAKFLIAGSYEERDSTTPDKPAGISEDDHAAHHAPKAKSSAGAELSISTVTVIRTADHSIMRRMDVPGAVHHVAVSPDGKRAAVTHPAEGAVSVIDLTDFDLEATIAVGQVPNYAAFSTDGAVIYVSNAGDNAVRAIRIDDQAILWTTGVGESPEHLVLSKTGARLFVNNADDGTVSILNTADGQILHSVKVGSALHGIDISDDEKWMYVAVRGDNKLVAVNLDSGQQMKTTLAPEPYHLATIRGMDKLYVSSASEPKIWVIETGRLVLNTVIPIGGKGHQFVQIPATL